MKLRRRVAELRSRMIRTRNRILFRNPPATSCAFPAASLEQAMEHVASREAGGGRGPALRRGLLDAPVKVVMSLVLTLRTPELRALLWRYLA